MLWNAVAGNQENIMFNVKDIQIKYFSWINFKLPLIFLVFLLSHTSLTFFIPASQTIHSLFKNKIYIHEAFSLMAVITALCLADLMRYIL